jgi:hypothetical protein
MARGGRFGKYGDFKRKEQIRLTRSAKSQLAKAYPAAGKATVPGRGKGEKKGK